MGGIVQVEDVGDWQLIHVKVDALSEIGHAAETGRQKSEAALDEALRGIADRCHKLLPPPADVEADEEVEGAASSEERDEEEPEADEEVEGAASSEERDEEEPEADEGDGDAALADEIADLIEHRDGGLPPGEIVKGLRRPRGVAKQTWKARVVTELHTNPRFTRTGRRRGLRWHVAVEKAPPGKRPEGPPKRIAVCAACRRDFEASPHGPLPKTCKRPDCKPVDAAHRGPAATP